MEENLNITVIVSTYNRTDFLTLCIKSLFTQSVLPKEIIICDDGSTIETYNAIQELKKNSPIPIVHVWQEDKGFRVAAIRNKGIYISTGNYIVQIDGDIIVHEKFIEDHIRMARPNTFLKGRRVYIKEDTTKKIISNTDLPALNFFTKGLRRRNNAIRNILLSKYLSNKKKSNRAIGCNMSFWKKDILEINGYDENFEGWGAEDVDVSNRFVNNGLDMRHLKFSAIAFHLWHKANDRSKENADYYKFKINSKETFCENGINKYFNRQVEEFIKK